MLKLGGAPFSVNIKQAYAPTSVHSDEVEEFYESAQNVMKHGKSGEINIVMGDWNAKEGNMSTQWQEVSVEEKEMSGEKNWSISALLQICNCKHPFSVIKEENIHMEMYWRYLS